MICIFMAEDEPKEPEKSEDEKEDKKE